MGSNRKWPFTQRILHAHEWRQEGKLKCPSLIRLKDGAPMVFAGIWEAWKSPEGETVESCAILTTSANKLVEELHDRMPVILHPHEYAAWLDRETTDPEALRHLYHPYPADLMEMYTVSRDVNSARSQGEEPVQPAVAQ